MNTYTSKRAAYLWITAAFGLGSCRTTAPLPEVPEVSLETERSFIEPAPSSGNATMGVGRMVFTGSYFHQATSTSGFRYATSDELPQALWVENRETDPVNGQVYKVTLQYPAPFDIVDYDARCANDFVVHGRDRQTGEEFFESWRIDRPQGAWDAWRPQAPRMGFPVPGWNPPMETIVGGGPFVPPAERRLPPTLERVRLYNVPAGQRVTDFAPDPDGRYLLFCDQSKAYQLVLGEDHAALIPGTESLQLGVHSITSIWIHQNNAGGRHAIIEAGGYDYCALLLDEDNDGYLDRVLEMDKSTYIDSFSPDDLDELVF